jgi:hypothetical protein
VIFLIVAIIWTEKKNEWLKSIRGISYEDVEKIIIEKAYKDILENPAKPDQMIFILDFKGYTHVVPFIIDKKNNIILKTIFPSRKFHKIYGKAKKNSKT